MNRRDFVGISSAGLLSGSLGPLSAARGIASQESARETVQAHSTGRPNLVFFMPDEMRADSLSCYGNEVCKTPNLDRLAGDGARFANCHVQFPVCGASRCSLLTGWPTSVRGHRSLFYFLRPEEPNLFRYLKRSGYDVFWFGKNDALAAASFYDSVTEWQEPGHSFAGRPADLTPGSLSMLYGPLGDRREGPDYASLLSAFRILERKESERPFCIFLPLLEPHPPYTAPQDFYQMYSPSSLPSLIPADLPKKPEFHRGIREMYGLSNLEESDFRKLRAVYYGKVSYSDWLLGELMEKLEKTGHDKDTAIFAFSDHGDYAGDYGLVEKWPSGLEDCLTHVPLIARVPGAKPGVVSDGMVELYDVMQTSLDLAGASAQHTHFARSLLPQIHGESADPNRAAFSEGGYNIYEPQCFEPLAGVRGAYIGKIRLQNERPETVSRSSMVRTRTHKLIRRPQGQSELYNSKEDPQERRNLYDEPIHAAIQHELQGKLLDHFVNTTGIAPMDKDSRSSPPYYPTRAELAEGDWQRIILDNSRG